jgi:hypothetical protein
MVLCVGFNSALGYMLDNLLGCMQFLVLVILLFQAVLPDHVQGGDIPRQPSTKAAITALGV